MTPRRVLAICATAVACLLCLYAIGRFMAGVPLRLAADSALEPNEDVCLDLVTRVGAGELLYGTPDFRYASSCYPPAYFHASWAAGRLSGIEGSFTAARLVSILATVGTCFLTYFALRACGQTRLSSLVAVGLFMAAYENSDCWYDLARVDALWVLFLAGAFWAQCLTTHWLGCVAAAMLLSLAMVTKQTTLLYLPVFLVNSFTRSKPWQALLVAGLPVAALGAAFALNEQMWRYTVAMIGRQDLIPGRIERFGRLGLPLMVGTVLEVLLVSRNGGYRHPLGWHCLLMYAAALGSGVLASLKIGGSVNHFMPFFYFSGVIAGLVLDAARTALPAPNRGHISAMVLVALQCLLLFNLGGRAQRQLRRAEGNEPLALALSQLPLSRKPIYCHDLRGNHLVRLAGFAPLLNAQSLIDLYVSGDAKSADGVVSTVRQMLARGEISYVLCETGALEGGGHWLLDHCESINVVETGSLGRVTILRVRGAEPRATIEPVKRSAQGAR